MEFDLAKLRKRIEIWDYQNPADYLRAIFQLIKSLRKPYTLQHYSEELGFGKNNTMAQIHSEHRPISDKAALRIKESLKLSKAEAKYFQTLVELKQSKERNKREEKLSLILELQGRYKPSGGTEEELSFFNSWQHAIVFELLDLQESRSIEQIRKKFAMPITIEEVKTSLALLEKLNVVRRQGESGYIKIQKDFSAGDSVPGMAIVRFHQEMMNLAKESLLETPPQQRDISSVTISIDEDMIERIKQDISLFRQYLLFLASQSKSPDKVMQLNVQLFPLSK